MANVTLASAVALPDLESDRDENKPAGVKRAAEHHTEQESKRQRTSPGKDSPQPQNGDPQDSPTQYSDESPVKVESQQRAEKTQRRSSKPVDEKQRSKRLFGALLGNLNQPRDRTTKKRQEIESRRKAELQQQDDERIEDKQKRLEELVEQRKKEQKQVDREVMRIRHRNMLDQANFLRTKSEPVLLYQPWTLRPEEEVVIQDQLDNARVQVDREVAEFESMQDDDGDGDRGHGDGGQVEKVQRIDRERPADESQNGTEGVSPTANNTNGQSRHGQDQGTQQEEEQGTLQDTNTEEQPDETNEAVQEERAAETIVHETPTDATIHDHNHNDDVEDHVEEGDEDTVIY